MARIKSALELAMEKTENVKVDKEALKAQTLKQEAKKIASLYLNDPEAVDLEQKLKDFPKDQQGPAHEAVNEVFLANIALPASEAALGRLAALTKGVGIVCKDRRVPALMEQLAGLYKQYLEDLKNLEAACRKQYGPKLKQKEEALSKRMGQQVHMDPMQDPEFVSFFQNNLNRLRDQYETALAQAREQLQSFFSGSSPLGGLKIFK
jgi:hypothetical protein